MADNTLLAADEEGIVITAVSTDDKIGIDLTNLVEQSASLPDTARVIIELADGAPYFMTIANLKAFLGIAEVERGTFKNADLSAGVLTISHTLGQQYVAVHIIDNNDEEKGLLELDCTASNTVTVNLSDFIPLAGDWRYIVIG